MFKVKNPTTVKTKVSLRFATLWLRMVCCEKCRGHCGVHDFTRTFIMWACCEKCRGHCGVHEKICGTTIRPLCLWCCVTGCAGYTYHTTSSLRTLITVSYASDCGVICITLATLKHFAFPKPEPEPAQNPATPKIQIQIQKKIRIHSPHPPTPRPYAVAGGISLRTSATILLNNCIFPS